MSHIEMGDEASEEQGAQADALQQLRNASLPDEFWMYSYKILPCPHGYRHSWTHCPFSHQGETARRRCPRLHAYLPDPCINARAKRQCPNGDACPYAHNTFEQWLHPARYRTRLCYLGANCRRPTCFFAHSVEELRSVDENDGALLPPQSQMPALQLQLPAPQQLPSPSPTVILPASGRSGDFAPTVPAPTASGPAITDGAPPLGLFQHVVLIPQPMPQQPMRPDLMPTHDSFQCYMSYQSRPAAVTRAPLPLPPPAPVHMQMYAPGAAPIAAWSQARPHLASPPANVPGSALHHPGSVLMTPVGGVYLNGAPPQPPAPRPSSSNLLGPLPPAPLPPQQHCFASSFVIPGGYHRRGGEMPPRGGGETAASVSTAPAFGNVSGSVSRTCGGGGSCGEQPPLICVASVGCGRQLQGLGQLPSAVLPAGLPPHTARGPKARGGGRGGGGNTAAVMPRHMPAPSNRGGAVRRVSASNSTSPTGVTAAAAAAAVITAMPHTEQAASAGSSPGIASVGSGKSSQQMQLPTLQQQQLQSDDGVEAALQSLAMNNSPEVPPRTPAVSYLGAGGSPYTRSSPQPRSCLSDTAANSPSTVRNAATAAAPAALTDMAILRTCSPAGSAAGSGTFSRPSSSGSGGSAGASLSTVYDTSNATVAALAASSARNSMTAVALPYQTLLQHMLRSASASAAEPPPGLVPVLLSDGGADIDTVHADLYYDGMDVELTPDRSSDPGPVGLHAAIRRISSGFGSSAAACRNSDPGQSVTPSDSGVQQLLLPLLQSVLTEGLATGQFELVNGQLQVNGSGGASPNGFAVPVAAAAAAAECMPPMEPAACAASQGVNA